MGKKSGMEVPWKSPGLMESGRDAVNWMFRTPSADRDLRFEEGRVQMAATRPLVVKLSDLVDGQKAVCYAALVKKTRGNPERNQPPLKCIFRDKRVECPAVLWKNDPLLREAESWTEGTAYRLEVRGELSDRYGMQLAIQSIRPAREEDAAEGYDFSDLYERSRYSTHELWKAIRDRTAKCIDDPYLLQLVEKVLAAHEEMLGKIQAAQAMHHPYTTGLLEHVRSMSRVAEFLANHYADYYSELDPPLDKGIVMASVLLHDIGKVRELEYQPTEARYTKEGRLIGHIVIGRDMVREVARSIDGFPEETLLLLEHAILAHHGKYEFNSPVLPQTMEALLVSYIDDLDAKMNIVARQRLRSRTDDDFTDPVYGLDGRRIYKGIPSGSHSKEEPLLG
jgi:3'-5' exoribonuclease